MYLFREDLCQYNAAGTVPLEGAVSVGWIDREHPFRHGRAPTTFVDKLLAVMGARSPLIVHASKIRGIEPCPICGESVFPSVDPDRNRLVGSSTIWIPKEGGGYFVSPSLIPHYIVDHEYAPPAEFIDAVELLGQDTEFDAQCAYQHLAEEATKNKPTW